MSAAFPNRAVAVNLVPNVLNEHSTHLMVTEPPDGIECHPDWRNRVGAAETKRTGKLMNDDRAE